MPWLGVRHNVAFGLAALRRPKRISSADRGSADPPLEAFIRPDRRWAKGEKPARRLACHSSGLLRVFQIEVAHQLSSLDFRMCRIHPAAVFVSGPVTRTGFPGSRPFCNWWRRSS